MKRRKYYVYALIDPSDNSIFYIGKGCGNRIRNHIAEYRAGRISNVEKYKAIDAIVQNGCTPIETKLAERLTETQAFMLERNLIKGLGDQLTNVQSGSQSEAERTLLRARWMLANMLPIEQWGNKQYTLDERENWRVQIVNALLHIERRALGEMG